MAPTLLGVVLDSSVLIAAERRNLIPALAFEGIRRAVGEIPIVLSVVSVAEIGHGIYRATTPELRARRRAFLDELKATIPVYPVTEITAEVAARVGGEQACKGIILPLPDLLIGACALELGYSVATGNVPGFSSYPWLARYSTVNRLGWLSALSRLLPALDFNSSGRRRPVEDPRELSLGFEVVEPETSAEFWLKLQALTTCGWRNGRARARVEREVTPSKVG